MASQQLSLLFFWAAVALYICAFIFYAAKIKLPSNAYLKWATLFLVGGLLAESGTIMFRYFVLGGFSSASFFDLFLYISWFVILEALIVEAWARVRILGFYASLLGIVLLLIAWSHYELPKSILKDVKFYWVVIHAGLIFVSYAAFIVSACAAIFYLLQERQLKLKKMGRLQQVLPSLEVLDETTYRFIVGGFIVFTIALTLGFSGAYKLWSTWDVWSVVTSLVAWALYMFYLLTRFKMGWVGKRSSYLAVFCLIPLIAIIAVMPYFARLHML